MFLDPDTPRWKGVTVICLFVWLFVYECGHVISNVKSLHPLWLCSALPCYYVADLLVGLVHFTGDFLAWPQFSYHHTDPQFMTQRGYVHHTFRSYCLAALIYCMCSEHFHIALWWKLSLLLTSFLAIQGNEMHVWLHLPSDRVPKLVQTAQAWGVVISTKEHRKHHDGVYDRHFCTLNGWTNPMLNLFTVFMFSRFGELHKQLATNDRYQSAVKFIAS